MAETFELLVGRTGCPYPPLIEYIPERNRAVFMVGDFHGCTWYPLSVYDVFIPTGLLGSYGVEFASCLPRPQVFGVLVVGHFNSSKN